jgi:hypothetical protein
MTPNETEFRNFSGVANNPKYDFHLHFEARPSWFCAVGKPRAAIGK